MSDYLERALGPEQAERLEQHLLICGSCEEYVAQMRAMLRALPKLADEPPPPSDDALLQLLARFDAGRGGADGGEQP